MGCGVSVGTDEGGGETGALPELQGKNKKVPSQVTQWKIIPDMKAMEEKFTKDGSLPKDMEHDAVELRALLEDPIGQGYIGRFAKEVMTQESFFAWVDIQEFRTIPTADFRRGKAMHIYQKYIKPTAVLSLGSLSAESREAIRLVIESARTDKSIITSDLFDDIQHTVFREMYFNTYERFKTTTAHKCMVAQIKGAYNTVNTGDFHYIDRIGEGGFGRVVHVVKKSTGTHYAMKIQLKTALLDTFSDDPTRIDHERRVFAVAHHPFIVGMDYAFQTPELCMMVLDLVTGGDLQEALNCTQHGFLSHERVVFYTAEIMLALSHLHDLGLMYRDLKPCNVLLCQDGHVKLADMGGVAEFAAGTVLDAPHGEESAHTPYSVTIGDLPQVEKDGQHGTLKNYHRRRSIMGTNGYMAPEMVILLSQPRSVRKGYSNAVDYWSLGVTMFKLLSGVRPFDRKGFDEFVEDTRAKLGKDFHAYDDLLKRVNFPPHIRQEARDVIVGLMDGNETTRLGSTPELFEKLKAMPYFEGIDWLKLSQRHMIPPYVPQGTAPRSDPLYSSFDLLMNEYASIDEMDYMSKETYDWSSAPSEADQQYFAQWDYVSMHTLKIELGIANEMASHDSNFKVRQLMGDKDTPHTHGHSPLRLGSIGRKLSKRGSDMLKDVRRPSRMAPQQPALGPITTAPPTPAQPKVAVTESAPNTVPA